MSNIEIYNSTDNKIEIQVNLDNETVWLTRAQMAELFSKDRRTVSEHIRNIFKEGELNEKMVCRKFRHTTQHGAITGKTQTQNIEYYNLDVIISVGYRVKSQQGTRFRIWATQRLKEYLIKGYSINQKRLTELQQTVQLIQKSIGKETNLKEAKGLLEINLKEAKKRNYRTQKIHCKERTDDKTHFATHQ